MRRHMRSKPGTVFMTHSIGAHHVNAIKWLCSPYQHSGTIHLGADIHTLIRTWNKHSTVISQTTTQSMSQTVDIVHVYSASRHKHSCVAIGFAWKWIVKFLLIRLKQRMVSNEHALTRLYFTQIVRRAFVGVRCGISSARVSLRLYNGSP